VYLFHRAGDIRRASDTAIKMLKKFDPDNKNMTMPDDEKTWRPFLDSMLRAISYPDIAKDTRCKDEHKILVDYMYDTASGFQLPENDPRRPAWDKLNSNMDKALAKIQSIKNPAGEFKDCQTLKVGPAGTGKTYLEIVEDEVQFRRKIAATRDLLSDMALEVAAKLKSEGKDQASNEYFEVAKQQINALQQITEDESASIKIKLAEIDIALGKSREAMNRLIRLKNQLPADSQLYFLAARKISELNFAEKKWAEAADFPSFMALTVGFNSQIVKERWPGMQDFLKQCYDNGVPIPPALKAKFEAKPAGDAPGKPDAEKAPEKAPEAPAAPKDQPKAEPTKVEPATPAAK
jgi:hypothetical protein